MRRLYILFLLLFLLAGGLLVGAQPASASLLTIHSQQDEVALNETFIVELLINSEHSQINAIEGVITYPTDRLKAISVSRGGSFLTLWAEEPQINTADGRISFVGGFPGGTTVIDGQVLTIIFQAKTQGEAEIGFDRKHTRVLLNDGAGRSDALTLSSNIFNISSANAVAIVSPTHPEEDIWYRNNTFTALWSAREEALYSYLLTDDPRESPPDHLMTREGAATFEDVPDGIYYFILKEKLPGKHWNVVGRRRVMIDSLPPLPITAVLTKDPNLFGGKRVVIFYTIDKISGINYYTITEGEHVTADASSPYVLRDQTSSRPLVIRATDQAGNTIEWHNGVAVTAPPFWSINHHIALLILIVGILVLFLILLRFHANKK